MHRGVEKEQVNTLTIDKTDLKMGGPNYPF